MVVCCFTSVGGDLQKENIINGSVSASGDCRIRRILGAYWVLWPVGGRASEGDARSGEINTMLGLSLPSLGGRVALDRVGMIGDWSLESADFLNLRCL